MIHLTTFLCLVLLVRGLELSIASLGGNKTSPLLYGLLYEACELRSDKSLTVSVLTVLRTSTTLVTEGFMGK